jgi:(p)ppGpp synthase/HD superfamily hydrolase
MPATTDRPVITPRYADAVAYACELHRTQVRKGSGTPYAAHLLSVSALVLEHGGDEDEAIAALLHDAVEDQGGLPLLAAIEARYGPRVAEIVRACSDSLVEDGAAKAPWRERKEQYLAHLAEAPEDVALVSAADKLHNARAIVADLRDHGAALWSRFNASDPAEQLWYYESLAAVLGTKGGRVARLAAELDRTVAEMRRLASA